MTADPAPAAPRDGDEPLADHLAPAADRSSDDDRSSAADQSSTDDHSSVDAPTPVAPPRGEDAAGAGAPLVGLIMGSDSDWRVMSGAAEVLDDLGVDYEVGVYSAHRTPRRMLDYAASAASRGLRVIIAGAGGAAHLPGMVASATVLPVIGVPVKLASLDGLDSLLSIVQMPAGIPVATVSIDGARNAGLLAARILATAPDLAGRALAGELQAYADDLQAAVLAKHALLRDQTRR